MNTRRTRTAAIQKAINLKHYRQRAIDRAERKREAEVAAQTRTPGIPYVRATPKVGRNELCPCGSTTKYKRCCA
jgi:uncharacterized protein YecA (UPF0149 family)